MQDSATRKIFVNGRWQEAAAVGVFQARNPMTGQLLSPRFPISSWEDCDSALDAAQEGAFARDHLAPALRKAGLGTKIWLHDHDPSKAGIDRVRELLAMPGVEEAVAGVAWHCYCSPSEAPNMAPLKAEHPVLGFYHTENGPHVVIPQLSPPLAQEAVHKRQVVD